MRAKKEINGIDDLGATAEGQRSIRGTTLDAHDLKLAKSSQAF